MNGPYFDAHCDTLTAFDGRYKRIYVSPETENYSKRGQIFAICGDDKPRPFIKLLEKCSSELKNMKNAVLCRNEADLLSAEANKKTAALLSIEGGEVINCAAEKIEYAASIGVKFIGLTWNIANGLAGTCVQDIHTGLTKKGVLFAETALKNDMVLDISHMSDPAAYETIELGGSRVYASHSNSRSICSNPRNLTDDLFITLSKKGGIIGINLYSRFLKDNGNAKISDVISTIEHFSSLFPGAYRHIALGCDLDGCDEYPDGINSSKDVEKIREALLKENYSDDIIKAIFYDNLRGYIKTAFCS